MIDFKILSISFGLWMVLGGVGIVSGQDANLLLTEDQVRALLVANPDNYGLMNTLGSIYMNSNQYDKAETEFQKLIGLNPDFAPVYVNYGFLEQRRKNYPEAVKYFTKAFSLNEKTGGLTKDNLVVAHISLGHCYGWLKRTDSAVEEYERACALGSPDQLLKTHNDLANLYLTKALDTHNKSFVEKAENHFDKVLSTMPSDPAANRGLKYVEAVKKELGIKEPFTVKQSGNTLIVFPKANEKEASAFKEALDKRKD